MNHFLDNKTKLTQEKMGMLHIMIVVVFILLYIFFQNLSNWTLKIGKLFIYVYYVSKILPQNFDIRAKIFEKTNNKGRNRKRRCQHFSSQRCLLFLSSVHSRIQLINIYQWCGGGSYSPGTDIYCINPQALGVNTVNKNKAFTFLWGK